MEFETLSQKVQWQARRVAAAFKVEEWETNPRKWPGAIRFQGVANSVCLDWGFHTEREALWFLAVGGIAGARKASEVRFGDAKDVYCFPKEPYNQLMVHGLFRLGLGSDVLDQFNHPLTAHEKLELRLSMPREFWPKTWRDEQGE